MGALRWVTVNTYVAMLDTVVHNTSFVKDSLKLIVSTLHYYLSLLEKHLKPYTRFTITEYGRT